MDTSQEITKSINQYLHLYLGCEVEVLPSGMEYVNHPTNRAILTGVFYDDVYLKMLDDDGIDLKASDIKPILRPLSNMTEEDAIELGKLLREVNTAYIRVNKKDSGYWQVRWGNLAGEFWDIENYQIFSQEQTVYLLKNGFDLFNLIPEGFAIDKTKK